MADGDTPIVRVENGTPLEQDVASAAVAALRTAQRRGGLPRAGTLRLVFDAKGVRGLLELLLVDVTRTHVVSDWTQDRTMS